MLHCFCIAATPHVDLKRNQKFKLKLNCKYSYVFVRKCKSCLLNVTFGNDLSKPFWIFTSDILSVGLLFRKVRNTISGLWNKTHSVLHHHRAVNAMLTAW